LYSNTYFIKKFPIFLGGIFFPPKISEFKKKNLLKFKRIYKHLQKNSKNALKSYQKFVKILKGTLGFLGLVDIGKLKK